MPRVGDVGLPSCSLGTTALGAADGADLDRKSGELLTRSISLPILTYFEGHLVLPAMSLAPSAPLATLGAVIGVGLAFGGAFYGLNLATAEARSAGSARRSSSMARLETSPRA